MASRIIERGHDDPCPASVSVTPSLRNLEGNHLSVIAIDHRLQRITDSSRYVDGIWSPDSMAAIELLSLPARPTGRDLAADRDVETHWPGCDKRPTMCVDGLDSMSCDPFSIPVGVRCVCPEAGHPRPSLTTSRAGHIDRESVHVDTADTADTAEYIPNRKLLIPLKRDLHAV
jgi:hypothetical protein